MAKTKTDLIATIRRYAEELERLGVLLSASSSMAHQRGMAHKDSDIDVAVFSEVFGPPHRLEFSVCSRRRSGQQSR